MNTESTEASLLLGCCGDVALLQGLRAIQRRPPLSLHTLEPRAGGRAQPLAVLAALPGNPGSSPIVSHLMGDALISSGPRSHCTHMWCTNIHSGKIPKCMK